ncbi:putative tail tube protein [Campylobacter phage F341]|nr:putative tail tube protein [Campylobacter phage F341]
MSLYNIDRLRSSLKQGGAINSKYKIDIKIPTLLRSLPFFKTVNISGEYLSIMANRTSIPGKSMSTVKVYHRGQPFVIRGAAQFNNTHKITFYNTPDMDIHQLFSDWIYRIDSFDSTITQSIFLGNYVGFNSVGAGYMSDIMVSQLSSDGKTETKFKLCYTFPIDIAEVELSASGKEISSTEVTFAYTYWERV